MASHQMNFSKGRLRCSNKIAGVIKWNHRDKLYHKQIGDGIEGLFSLINSY